MKTRSTPVLIAVIGLLGLVLLLIAGLVWEGRDPSQVVYFASGPVALGIISLVLGSRIDSIKGTAEDAAQTAVDNNAKLDTVSTAVNGQMSAQFDAIHKRLDYLGAPPAGAIGPSVPPRTVPPSPPAASS